VHVLTESRDDLIVIVLSFQFITNRIFWFLEKIIIITKIQFWEKILHILIVKLKKFAY